MLRFLASPRIRRYLRPERPRIVVALIAMTARGVLSLGVPFFFGRTIGLVADGAAARQIWSSAGAMVGVALVNGVAQFWMRWLYIGSSRRFEWRLRNELFEHLTKLSFRYFNKARTGDIMSRLTADVEAVRMGVGPGVMHLYQTSVMAVGAVSVMLWYHWQLTLVALVPMLLILGFIRTLMPRMHEASLRVQEQLAHVSAMAQESFSGSRVVKAFAREDYEIGRFRGVARRYIDDSMSMAMVRAKMHTGIEIMAGLVMVAVLYFGGREVIRGSLALGPFVSFFGYFMMLVWPMIAIGWTMALFQRAFVALERLEAVFDTEPEITSGPVADLTPRGAWRLSHLTYRHDGQERPALDDVSLELPAGGSLAIVGPTGSGKSTLVQVFARLFDPPPGQVFLDDTDIRDLDLDVLRRSIAMVPQETFLFSDTLRANIAYADESAAAAEGGGEKVLAAAEAAQVKDAILEFENGFDQIIGERGITLSGGQKQRVAIARALLHEAPTLILDDCLSAVDTHTEERILEHLRRIMVGRTTIIVAHRLSAVMHCDEIVVLKDGRIAERGTHDELAAAQGWYAETYRRQLLSEELEAA